MKKKKKVLRSFWIKDETEFWAKIFSTRNNPFSPFSFAWIAYGLWCGRCYTLSTVYWLMKKYYINNSDLNRQYRDYPEQFTIKTAAGALSRLKEDVPVYRVGSMRVRVPYKGRLRRKRVPIYHVPQRDADYVPETFFGFRSPRHRESRTYINKMYRRLWVAGVYHFRVGKAGKPNRLVWVRLKAVRSFLNPKISYYDLGKQ
jgi:hypothetical protein